MLDPVTCQTPVPLPLIDDTDRFHNVFLGQTIALSLNVRLDPTLPTFVLPEGPFCTEPAGLDGVVVIIGYFQIPPEVIAALQTLWLPNTVGGLLELANRALADLPTGGATVLQINSAVDTINRAFDKCRRVVGCEIGAMASGAKTSSAGLGPQALERADSALPVEFELGRAYPNPFNPSTRVTLALPKATNWMLSFYTVSGQLVSRFRGYAAEPGYVDVTWDGTNLKGEQASSGIYFYRLVAGEFTATRKAILLK
jgi:hypothetical protein